MNKWKKWIIVITVLLMSTGCAVENDKLHVTVIVKSTTSQFFKSVQSGANAASKEYNIELLFTGPDNEEEYQTQIDMIDMAIRERTDAIVLSAIDYERLAKPVERAVDAGIPVLIIDSDVHSDEVSARITTNNASAGKMAAKPMQAFTNKKIVVGIVNFDAKTANGQERETGFRKAIEKNVEVSAIYSTNVQSNIESATLGTEKLLQDHPDINTLVTFNEWTTLGVGYAIRNMNKMDDTYVVGFDNNPVSVGMLETGEVDSLIVQTPFVMGYLGVEQAQKIITKKKKVEKSIYTKTVLINKENMFDTANQKIIFPFD